MMSNVGVEVWSLDVTSNAGLIVLGCADGTVRMLKEAGTEAGRSNRGEDVEHDTYDIYASLRRLQPSLFCFAATLL
ncbi:MAG: hypothetical protein IPM83_12780 [Ignavibacteria bacterium]|nr:hypothetical protein [Ignavibacteria bacterium]